MTRHHRLRLPRRPLEKILPNQMMSGLLITIAGDVPSISIQYDASQFVLCNAKTLQSLVILHFLDNRSLRLREATSMDRIRSKRRIQTLRLGTLRNGEGRKGMTLLYSNPVEWLRFV